ncbi:type III-B CRISPR module RAMP protein Cmr4 [Saccharibacillus sacchari]|uniref:Type III-B CRISPR module RAMP protein Cmr4 n=1 Tax=Saccharibacillus sacchari TaxID=456493 RepID=A0ACC6PC44_9BACL
MTQTSSLYWLHTLSPLHVGNGEGVGVIDMPIMREKVTEWPLIPGSSMKGVQRDFYKTQWRNEAWLKEAFGTGGDQDANAGALVMTDGRILAFPVASRYGTFAYVTCPLVLRRLRRDTEAAGQDLEKIKLEGLQEFANQIDTGVQSWVTKTSVIISDASKNVAEVYLDEFAASSRKEERFDTWAANIGKLLFDSEDEQKIWQERVVLVSDDAFQYFVTMCCEVTPRIRILTETKTVDNGALWNEEYVPTEALFYGLIWCDQRNSSAKVNLLFELKASSILQIGGNATVGKGRVRCKIDAGGTI